MRAIKKIVRKLMTKIKIKKMLRMMPKKQRWMIFHRSKNLRRMKQLQKMSQIKIKNLKVSKERHQSLKSKKTNLTKTTNTFAHTKKSIKAKDR